MPVGNKEGNFRKLVDDVPAEALKYMIEVEKNPFFHFYLGKLRDELSATKETLLSCDIPDVLRARGYYEGVQTALKYPDMIRETLLDNIAMAKEAAEIEAARKPEKKNEKV